MTLRGNAEIKGAAARRTRALTARGSDPVRRGAGEPAGRRFLFLQGPHGPFFDRLARMLRAAGAECLRIGFNRGDAVFWGQRGSYLPFRDRPEDWPDWLSRTITDRGVTDLVLYGDTRPVHAQAVAIAQGMGLCVHVFEEGYLRPYWITYERGGSNGNSRLMRMSVTEMRATLAKAGTPAPPPPAQWGDLREHVFYGALYHFHVLALNRGYPHFRTHRALAVAEEFRLHLRRLLLMPAYTVERFLATRRVRYGGFPYHLVLLQLEHDASFRDHGTFETLEHFAETCLAAFAEGAPRHHHIVFKAHPLDDGRGMGARRLARLAHAAGIGDRVHFVRGGKLAALLNEARSAVTVNSTAAQQVLWRGLPLRAFGAAVYAKPEFASRQPLAEFFAAPDRPDLPAYHDFRDYLLETSQVPGGFYAARSRQLALRQVVDLMLASEDPYDALGAGTAAPRQQLRLVR